MEIKERSFSIESNATVRYVEVGKSPRGILVAWEKQYVEGRKKPTITEGLSFISNVRRGNYIHADPKTSCVGNVAEYVLTSDDALETARTQGFEYVRNWREDPFTLFTKHGSLSALKKNGYQLVLLSGYCHGIWDMEDRPLPTAFDLNYISAKFNNLYFNLDKLLDILSKRDDVVIRGKGIESLPSYSSSRNKTHFISATWQPSVKDFRRVMKKAYEIECVSRPISKNGLYLPSEYVVYEVIFDTLDVLKVGKALKYRFTEYVHDEPCCECDHGCYCC